MKIITGRSYGSIGHLPGSRRGPADKGVNEGQERIACHQARDRHDVIIVQEKLDGSNVAVVKVDGKIHAIGRSGYSAASSPYEHHHLFAVWVAQTEARFGELLKEGERVCGEWLALAHGTRYELLHEPFIAFDLRAGEQRLPYEPFVERAKQVDLVLPHLLHYGAPFSVEAAMEALGPHGFHGAIDQAEGAVWRVERCGAVDFLAKYVRPEKVDGRYLPEQTGCEPIWHWRPEVGGTSSAASSSTERSG